MKRLNLNKLFSIGLTILYLPLVWMWLNVMLDFAYAANMRRWLFYLMMTSYLMISTVILTCLRRSLISLKRPFCGALAVGGFFAIIPIVLLAINDEEEGIGVLIAILFVVASVLFDKPIRAFWIRCNKNRSAMVASLYMSGIILFVWAICFLFSPFSKANETAIVWIYALLGYTCFLGGLYDIGVSCYSKAWLTRLLSMTFMIGFSLIGMISNGAKLYNDGVLVFVNSTLAFWTAMGLLLYDLGCFVAERIRKKLASKKQGSLEETAEA